MLAHTQRSGRGTFHYADGDVYVGDWTNDIQNGKGIYKFQNGDVYEGDYVQGERTGEGIFKYENGDRYTGHFLEGNKDGDEASSPESPLVQVAVKYGITLIAPSVG